MSTTDETPQDIRCEKCGYKWEYTGKLWYATCPRCNGKTKTPLNDDYYRNKLGE